MKLHLPLKTLIFIFALAVFQIARAQTNAVEILTNEDVVLMTQNQLADDLIADKIKESKGAFDVSVAALVTLKKAGVSDKIVRAMMDKSRVPREQTPANTQTATSQTIVDSVPTVVKNAAEALRAAKTLAIEKSSVNPSRQSLEKELLKRQDWQKLNLNIVRYREAADLRVEIGFVPLSLLTHRYVFRVYDNRSGTVITAGETTSWGSLAKNLAREISKKLNGVP